MKFQANISTVQQKYRLVAAAVVLYFAGALASYGLLIFGAVLLATGFFAFCPPCAYPKIAKILPICKKK